MNNILFEVKKENLIAELFSEKNEYYILKGFTDKIKYVFKKDECAVVKKSNLNLITDYIGFDSFYKKLYQNYQKIKDNIFTKKYKNNTSYSKVFLKDINIFLVYKCCYDDLKKEEIEKINDMYFKNKNIQIPYLKSDNENKKISSIHFYKNVIESILNKKVPNITTKFTDEYYNKTIKTYYNFFEENI